jgi:hypothetical protein
MKKIILLLALVGFSHSIVFSQGCLPEGITFTTQEQIDNFQTNYPGCTEIEGNVLIGSVNGNLDIMNLEGLNSINKILGRLEIIGCHAIGNLSGLNSLTQVGDNLLIADCTELDNLYGLNSLTQVNGSFILSGNNYLTTIQDLEFLTMVNGDLWIEFNQSLSSLSGLNNLTTVDSSLHISHNIHLEDITALENINPYSIHKYLIIWYNDILSDCAIQSICDYLLKPDGLEVIHYNDVGCNSPEEVQDHCLTSMQELQPIENLIVFPNPASDLITINVKESNPLEQAIIYNHLGQKVLEAKPVNYTVDVSGLRPGIYFIEVATKEWKGRSKLVKQ